MKKYWALYKKELKSILWMSTFFVVIMVLIYVTRIIYAFISPLVTYYIIADSEFIRCLEFVYYRGLRFVLPTTYMLPVILAYSINIERKTKSHYLLHSLPVPKYSAILIKFMVVISMGALLAFLITVIDKDNLKIHIYCWISVKFEVIRPIITQRDLDFHNMYVRPYYKFPYRPIAEGVIRTLGKLYFWSDSLRIFSHIFAYCGMVCLAQGIMMTVKRYRTLVWIGAFMVSFSTFVLFYERVVSWPVYSNSIYILQQKYDPVSYYSFLAGLLSLFIGLYLYEKYAEI